MNDSRLYSCSDATFMGWLNPRLNLLKEEENKFIQFSNFFTPARLLEVEELIAKASTIPSDNVYVDFQAQATENVVSSTEECGKFFQACKFDIENAFPNKKHIWNQFGFNDYELARRTGKAMYLFYSDFLLIANIHKNVMLSEGWSEETYIKITELMDRLKMNLDQQTRSRIDRSRATDERITCLNSIYEKMAKYMKAAKIIYGEDEEMLKWFKFPVTRNTNSESPELETQEETV